MVLSVSSLLCGRSIKPSVVLITYVDMVLHQMMRGRYKDTMQ